MKELRGLKVAFTFVFLFGIVFYGNLSAGVLPGGSPSADSLFMDNFNRPGPDPGAFWTADAVYQIVSNELANTDVSPNFDDLAVFNPLINPVGVSFKWGVGVDPEGMQSGGLALMLDGASTTANGYFIFKHLTANNYKLWVIENGTASYQVDSSPSSEYPYFVSADDFQVAYTSDDQGHHFDIFVNGRFDVRVSDPAKTFGNSDSLYAGVLLAGNFNNNVDDFTFYVQSDDSIAPSGVVDLDVFSRTATSVTLSWTAPGDDDSTGTASTYDVRYSSGMINDSNFTNATRGFGEPAPAPFGSSEQFEVTGLDPDTRYYFAMKSDDGFPNRNVSVLSNVISIATLDNIPPSEIQDLTVTSVNSRTALLAWTATGDNGVEGQASVYDVRYSTSPITESNFFSASQAVGEPDPQPSGSAEEFTVGGLDPATLYYFAIKAKDEANNYSPLSFVPNAETVSYPTVYDDFERGSIGPDWNADPDFSIVNGELSNESLTEIWDYIAAYSIATNPEWVSLRWGTNADMSGISSGGFALMLDAPSPDANGYLLFRHSGLDRYQLYEVVAGAPSGSAVGSSPTSNLPYPVAGDEFSVVMSTDANGHHFDCYINGVYDTRVSDPGMVQGSADTLWSGVMLHGNRNNNVEDFWASGLGANVAPSSFSLLSPSNGSTVETGTPMLDWEDSVDPNLTDSVLYSLEYGTSPVFAPESTTVIDDLVNSDYSIPPMDLVTLVRQSMSAAPMVESGKATEGEPVMTGAMGGKDNPSPSTLPDDVVIYWKVRAYDTGGLETWSSETNWSFVVSIPEPPLPFSLLTPLDGDTVSTLTPTLSWQATTDPDPGDVITYTLYYDDQEGFPSAVIIAGLQETSFATPALVDGTTYYWKVEAVDSKDLITESSETFSFVVLLGSGIGDGDGGHGVLPKVFAMGQNYPNPFNPSTSIRYDVPEDASSEAGVPVLFQIYTLRGQLVATLEDSQKSPGSYVVHWDGRDDSGEHVGSGIYLYRIQAGTFSATKKMVVLK